MTGPGTTSNWCSVRVLVNRHVALPDSVLWDNTADLPQGQVAPGARSIERTFGPVGSGRYTLTVEYAGASGGVQLVLDGWELSVERLKA
jgi:hypothetical protein